MSANGFMSSIIGVFTMLVVVAIIAELVSSKSQTSNVITAAFSGFSSVLKAAVAPVT